MFWICAGDSIDNIEMVLFYGPVVEQCLHGAKAFSASRTTPAASSLGGKHKKLAGDTARTADLNRPKGYSTPYDVILSI